MAAHGVTDRWSSEGPYIHSGGVFPSHVVYDHKGQTLKRPYTATQGPAGTAPEINLGEPKSVHMAYVDSENTESKAVFVAPTDLEDLSALFEARSVGPTLQEGEELMSEGITFSGMVTVKESSITTIPVKLIAPGWGSMGFYGKDVLQRDGPSIFKKGTPMMWNHATESEDQQRPEGDLNNMAAILTEDAHWEDKGAKGPGLYSKAKVFSDYATQVAEKGPHIGVSINAAVRAHEGTIEGRTGRIVDKFVHAYSTDFVTKAGAGGAPIVPVQEADRGNSNKETTMARTDEEFTTLESERNTLKSQLSNLLLRDQRRTAFDAVSAVLEKAEVPFSKKLLERACESPAFKDGKLDETWAEGVVKDFSESETGAVTGLGGGDKRIDTEAYDKRITESLQGKPQGTCTGERS